MKHIRTLVLSVVAAISLAACGGGGDGASQQAVVDAGVEIPINVDTGVVVGAALQGSSFTFDAIPDLDLPGETTLAFAGTGDTTTFTLTSGGEEAVGVMDYGSCIFRVTRTTFKNGRWSDKTTAIRVNPCSVKLKNGLVADTLGKTVEVNLNLGKVSPKTARSTITIAVNPTTGAVTLVVAGQTRVLPAVRVPVKTLTGGTNFTGSTSVR